MAKYFAVQLQDDDEDLFVHVVERVFDARVKQVVLDGIDEDTFDSVEVLT